MSLKLQQLLLLLQFLLWGAHLRTDRLTRTYVCGCDNVNHVLWSFVLIIVSCGGNRCREKLLMSRETCDPHVWVFGKNKP